MAQQSAYAGGTAFVASLQASLTYTVYIRSHSGSSGWQVNLPSSQAVAGRYANIVFSWLQFFDFTSFALFIFFT